MLNTQEPDAVDINLNIRDPKVLFKTLESNAISLQLLFKGGIRSVWKLNKALRYLFLLNFINSLLNLVLGLGTVVLVAKNKPIVGLGVDCYFVLLLDILQC